MCGAMAPSLPSPPRRIVPLPCARARAICIPRHAPRPCPVAVGRDVPIASPRHGAVRGLAPRSPRPRPLPRPRTLAVRPRNPKNLCVPIQPAQTLFVFLCVKNPPRHCPWRLAPRSLPPFSPPLPTRITRAARWSAAGPPGSRPTALTPAQFSRPRPVPAPLPRAAAPHRPRRLTAAGRGLASSTR